MTYTSKNPKFSTITATGNVTVDTDTLHVDSTNNRVGVGTITPAEALNVLGNTRIEDPTGTVGPNGQLGVGVGIVKPLVTQSVDNTSGAASGDFALVSGIYLVKAHVAGGHRRSDLVFVGGSQSHSAPVTIATSTLNSPSTTTYSHVSSNLRVTLNADNTQGAYDVSVMILQS